MSRRLLPTITLTASLLTAGLLALPALADDDTKAATFEPIDHAPFSLRESPSGIDYGAMVDKTEQDSRIKKASLEDVVTTDSPARTGRYPLCHKTNLDDKLEPSGFCWDNDDDTSPDWVPQGISGSGDAEASGKVDGRRLVSAGWHSKDDAYARVSIADFTKPSKKLSYHHLLLVQPTKDGNFTGANKVHASGMMWFGDKLFVSTGERLQVYSLDHIWQTRTDGDSAEDIGLIDDDAYARWHRWAMPMVAEYRTAWNDDGSQKNCETIDGDPCLSAMSLAPDRETFVSAEYDSAEAGGGRVVRWGLDADTGLPSGKATEAFSSPIWHQQGVATDGNGFYVTGDCPGDPPPDDPNNHICIHKALPEDEPHVFTKAPPLTQNLSYWPKTDELWGINERIDTGKGKRVVFKITP